MSYVYWCPLFAVTFAHDPDARVCQEPAASPRPGHWIAAYRVMTLVDEDAASYVGRTLTPTLTRGLVVLCKTKPDNPVEWLGHWLSANRPTPESVAVPTTRSVVINPMSGETVEVEDGEEVKACTRCYKLFITTSGKSMCLHCRKEFIDFAASQELDVEGGEELKKCVQCAKIFTTFSGKDLCTKCRPKEEVANVETTEMSDDRKRAFMEFARTEGDLEEGEEVKKCILCTKIFTTFSGKDQCSKCR